MARGSDGVGGRWFALSAWLYYVVAGAYYVHQWFLVLGTISALGGVAVWWSGFIGRASEPTGATLLVFGFVGTFAGAAIFLRKIKRRFQLLNPGLDIVESEDTYEVLPHDKYRFGLRMRVKAIVDGVDKYRLKLRWTGEGTIKYQVPEGFQAAPNNVRDVWELTEIRFPHHLALGQEIDFEIRMEMHDATIVASPYLRKLVDDSYPNGLTMRVILRKDLRDAHCTATIFPSSRTDVAVQRPQNLPCDQATGEVKWIIRRPRFGFRYRLLWAKKQSA